MVVGAQGDEIPGVIVIVIAVKVMDFHYQVPTANTAFAFVVEEASGSIVFVGPVVRVILPAPVKAIIAGSAAGLFIRVFERATLGAWSPKLRVFRTFEDVPG